MIEYRHIGIYSAFREVHSRDFTPHATDWSPSTGEVDMRAAAASQTDPAQTEPVQPDGHTLRWRTWKQRTLQLFMNI